MSKATATPISSRLSITALVFAALVLSAVPSHAEERPPPVDERLIGRSAPLYGHVHAGDGDAAGAHVCGDAKFEMDKPYDPPIPLDRSVVQDNPHRLAVEVLNPYTFTLETHPSWGPPGHWTPWNGDWAGDIWRDNFTTGLGNTCGVDVYLKLRPVQVAGGQLAQEVRARVVGQGFACASGVYSQGGYMQRYAIDARYGSTWYELGWVLFAHLDNRVYGLNAVLGTNTRIGTAFQGGSTGPCWGSCHIHVEMYNNRGYSCYRLLPPTTGVGSNDGIGALGGGLPGGHCPNFTGGGGGPPTSAPTNLSPDNWVSLSTPSVNHSWSAVAGATSYNLYMLYWDGSAWQYYWDWNTSTTSFTVWPQFSPRYYAWKVTPRNSAGEGPGSAWAYYYHQ